MIVVFRKRFDVRRFADLPICRWSFRPVKGGWRVGRLYEYHRAIHCCPPESYDAQENRTFSIYAKIPSLLVILWNGQCAPLLFPSTPSLAAHYLHKTTGPLCSPPLSCPPLPPLINLHVLQLIMSTFHSNLQSDFEGSLRHSFTYSHFSSFFTTPHHPLQFILLISIN